MCDRHCIDFVALSLGEVRVAGRRVLEVGSRDVNGSVRATVCALRPREYVGVDLQAGAGVDVVADATELVSRFGRETFDIVISTEMLEHVYDWRAAVIGMKEVVRPGGTVCLTTRRKGFRYHEYPADHWRFEPEDMQKVFADFDDVVTAVLPNFGVGVRGVKPSVPRPAVDLAALKPFAMTRPQV